MKTIFNFIFNRIITSLPPNFKRGTANAAFRAANSEKEWVMRYRDFNMAENQVGEWKVKFRSCCG